MDHDSAYPSHLCAAPRPPVGHFGHLEPDLLQDIGQPCERKDHYPLLPYCCATPPDAAGSISSGVAADPSARSTSQPSSFSSVLGEAMTSSSLSGSASTSASLPVSAFV